jgi:hypothetical protein
MLRQRQSRMCNCTSKNLDSGFARSPRRETGLFADPPLHYSLRHDRYGYRDPNL